MKIFGKQNSKKVLKVEELTEEKKMLKLLRSSIENQKRILNSKEMLCACYLYKFIEDNDVEAYREFLSIFSTLTIEERNKVFVYYYNFPKENRIDKKSKVKKKGNDIDE